MLTGHDDLVNQHHVGMTLNGEHLEASLLTGKIGRGQAEDE